MILIREKRKVKEKQNLDEMAIQVASSLKDGLPFRVTVQTPDNDPPHAHIRDLRIGKQKLGAFLIPQNPPRSPDDIKDFEEGLTEEMRSIVFRWINRRSTRGLPGFSGTNLDLMKLYFLSGRLV
jgi:hypothetical protein